MAAFFVCDIAQVWAVVTGDNKQAILVPRGTFREIWGRGRKVPTHWLATILNTEGRKSHLRWENETVDRSYSYLLMFLDQLCPYNRYIMLNNIVSDAFTIHLWLILYDYVWFSFPGQHDAPKWLVLAPGSTSTGLAQPGRVGEQA
jgi:hypothetical protein